MAQHVELSFTVVLDLSQLDLFPEMMRRKGDEIVAQYRAGARQHQAPRPHRPAVGAGGGKHSYRVRHKRAKVTSR